MLTVILPFGEQIEFIDGITLWRVWFVALFLETLLYGCGLLQAWIYFQRCGRDHWRLKATVAFVTILEGMQTIIFFELLFKLLLVQNGKVFKASDGVYWEEIIQSFPTYLSTFVVQMHFTMCVYHLKETDRLMPICIATLAMIALAAAFAQATISILLGVNIHLGFFGGLDILLDARVIALYMLQSSATFICDVMITVSLLRRLSIAKSGIKKSDAMVNRLMINSINRGGLTAVAAAINLILILTSRDSLAFILPLIISSKLYMNSILASLNSRAGIKEKYMNGPVTDGGMAISNGPLSTIEFVQSIPEDHPGAGPVLEITVHSDAWTDNQQEKVNGTLKRRGSV